MTPADSPTRPVAPPDGRSTLPQPATQPHEAGTELPADRFLEREISWLQFNERVLELAADDTVPLLERARFLAIFASNLDEFFMVRVAGLKRRLAAGMAVRSASGLEPRVLLDEIWRGARELMRAHAALFADEVAPALAAEGITIVPVDSLSAAEQQQLARRFEREVYPVLTPLAVDPVHPFPYISGLSLNLALILVNPATGHEHFARVKVPQALPRLLRVASPEGEGVAGERDDVVRLVALEDLIAHHLDMLFPGTEVAEVATFRVTRNEDLEVEEDDAENLLTALERELTRRRFGPPVRLEADDRMSERLLDLLVRELRMRTQEVVTLPPPLDLRALNAVADLDRSPLRFDPVSAHTHPDLAPVERSAPSDVLGAMRSNDVLLHHPYDSFSTSVQAFLEQAATDPHVLAIKQTLYRTSGDSPIIDALIEAAEAGKQVLAVVEIKARFDEENNIVWARKLEQAGVHVVYGIVGLKTHAKLALVVRQEPDGLRRYVHIGTGNYNPRTARVYEDFGLLTTDETVGEDVTRLFNQLSGLAPRSEFSRLLVAPRTVRAGLLERIAAQAERARRGEDAYVGLKVNALVDEKVIDALYEASRAGVRVDVLVRGICALRPGVPGLSETIRVRSVLGRFLEHSRVFIFGPDAGSAAAADDVGAPQVLIGSADMMHRNLDRRVEALVRISDPVHEAHLREVMSLGMSDDTATWHLGTEGSWVRHHLDADGQPLRDLQMTLVQRYDTARRQGQRR